MIDRLGPKALWLARTAALLGGAALVLLILLTVVSVTGRNLTELGLGPIPGDFELVEAGVAFAIFAFMPWCQINRGHATVEILTGRLGERANAFIDLVTDVLLLAVWVYLGWRHYLGMMDKQTYAETTFILQFPIWWAYAAAMAGIVVIILVACFCVLRSGRDLFAMRGEA